MKWDENEVNKKFARDKAQPIEEVMGVKVVEYVGGIQAAVFLSEQKLSRACKVSCPCDAPGIRAPKPCALVPLQIQHPPNRA